MTSEGQSYVSEKVPLLVRKFLSLPWVRLVPVTMLLCGCMLLGGSAQASGSLVWWDEFDGPSGSRPDSSNWVYETGGHGWGNNELEYYTDAADNSRLDGMGHLKISAMTSNEKLTCWYGPCRYTSARLTTREKFSSAYGKFEARIKLPRGRGVWPAYWLLGNNIDTVGYPSCGEIDVMENSGAEPETVRGSLHAPNFVVSDSYKLAGSDAFADNYHLFGVSWNPKDITFSVDDNRYATKNRADVGNAWFFDHPFYMILNLAIGGSSVDSPDETTSFPAEMLVDYVRVYSE
jgi:beta-glucanase (GH16 family)